MTESIIECRGFVVGSSLACFEAKDLSSERRQKSEGASRAPKTMPMGMIR